MGKRGPAPTGKGTTIGVRCQDDFIKALEAWRGGQAVPPSRAAALRHLAEEALRAPRRHGVTSRKDPRGHELREGRPLSGRRVFAGRAS